MNSRDKGKRGELELSACLRGYGFEARRGQQYKGSADSPDVVGIPGFHIEVKRVEKGSLYDWLDQARRDAGRGEVPIVCHRRNRKEWVVVMSLDAFVGLIPIQNRKVL